MRSLIWIFVWPPSRCVNQRGGGRSRHLNECGSESRQLQRRVFTRHTGRVSQERLLLSNLTFAPIFSSPAPPPPSRQVLTSSRSDLCEPGEQKRISYEQKPGGRPASRNDRGPPRLTFLHLIGRWAVVHHDRKSLRPWEGTVTLSFNVPKASKSYTRPSGLRRLPPSRRLQLCRSFVLRPFCRWDRPFCHIKAGRWGIYTQENSDSGYLVVLLVIGSLLLYIVSASLWPVLGGESHHSSKGSLRHALWVEQPVADGALSWMVGVALLQGVS